MKTKPFQISWKEIHRDGCKRAYLNKTNFFYGNIGSELWKVLNAKLQYGCRNILVERERGREGESSDLIVSNFQCRSQAVWAHLWEFWDSESRIEYDCTMRFFLGAFWGLTLQTRINMSPSWNSERQGLVRSEAGIVPAFLTLEV